MPEPSLFHGIAVLIDDEIEDAEAGINQIRAQIEDAGCHVVALSALPKVDHIANFREVSFFVLDWNLYGRSIRAEGDQAVQATSELKRQNAVEAIEFLKKLKEVCVAPVFIFTNENIAEVEDLIKEHADLYSPADPSHLLVKSKSDVTATGVFDELSRWMKNAPSVYVLKKWERAYAAAKNELFRDFYSKSVRWPMVLWKTYQEDGVLASAELGNVIGRNLLSRMTPLDFDLTPFEGVDKEQENNRTTVLKVLEGERFLSEKQIHKPSIATTGDVFKKGGNYFVNIRPICDCIARSGETQDEIEAYLLKGSKLSDEKVGRQANRDYGTIPERDNESVVFAMTDGKTVSFQFKELLKAKSGEWMKYRIGRLLPPYLTRLQQRYSAYLQRPGLSRIPNIALPPTPVNAEPAAIEAPSAVPLESP